MGSGAYSFPSRSESGTGTNPEELVIAAHTGCFSRAPSHSLTECGFPQRRVELRGDLSVLQVAADGIRR